MQKEAVIALKIKNKRQADVESSPVTLNAATRWKAV
jgi:hypothetical protein